MTTVRRVVVGLGVLFVAVLAAPGLLLWLIIAAIASPVGFVGANAEAGRDIPPAALAAYELASARIGQVVSGCAVPAPVLMAIGKLESNHAAGSSITAGGRVDPPIVGAALDGSIPGTAAVADT